MKKKKKDKEAIEAESLQLVTGRMNLEKMKYQDLQRACIIRGMDFDEMVKKDLYGLQKWLTDNWLTPTSVKRLNDFDNWREKALDEKYGKGEPFVRLGFIGKVDAKTGEVKEIKREKFSKKKKVKRERDESLGSIYKGTKKALTFQCVSEGLDLDQTIKKVTSSFPDALDKSIKIWIKKALKAGVKPKKVKDKPKKKK